MPKVTRRDFLSIFAVAGVSVYRFGCGAALEGCGGAPDHQPSKAYSPARYERENSCFNL
jgi:hypothetical protein